MEYIPAISSRYLPSPAVTEPEYEVVTNPDVANIGTYYEKVDNNYVKTSDSELVEGKTYYVVKA